jgi:glycosyltransferase involved in cell wall biosynthesis
VIDQDKRERPYATIKQAIELFHARQGQTIVEIGSMRQPLTHDLDDLSFPCCNDGHSSMHWAQAAKRFFSVDISPECTAITRQSLQNFGYTHAEALNTDGLQFLKNFGGQIDLLYLDAWDVGTSGCAEHHLEAYRLAKPWLHNNSIILIDDTDLDWDGCQFVLAEGIGGKGKLVVPEAQKDGYEILAQGRQVLLAKKMLKEQVVGVKQPLQRVLIEGWRFVPHSYSFVMAGIVAELCYRSGFDIRFEDRPYYRSNWKSVWGINSIFAEKTLANLSEPEPGWQPDYVLRFDFPLRLTPVDGAKTIVFGTTELGQLTPEFLAEPIHPKNIQLDPSVTIMTPSMWSRRGFIESGIADSQVAVVPLGVETEVFAPLSSEARQNVREKLCWDNRFVILNVGGGSDSKGIPLILKSVAQLAKKHPRISLCLKGLDSLYGSESKLLKVLNTLSPEDRELVEPRLIYVGKTLSIREMATLYQAADLYFSPYYAEGFNLPVLEAAACGLPIVCTGGGSTDDFVDGRFARRIESKLRRGPEGAWYLEPDPTDIVSALHEVIDDKVFLERARTIAPTVVRSAYTWGHTVGKLLKLF